MRVLPLALIWLLAFTACSENIQPLIRQADLPNLGIKRQQQLAAAGHWEIRRAIAGNRHTDSHLLAQLSRDPDPRVRIAVATNLSTQEKVRTQLAQDPNIQVRSVVARFEYVASTTLDILAHDPDVDIRHEVAGNWNTANATLARLSHDPYPSVSRRAAMALEQRHPH